MSSKNSLLTPLLFFALANLLFGLYAGLYDPSFNNYLAQVHNVSEVARGGLEFPRELPGFLIVLIFTALIFLPDTRIAMLSALLVGISLWGQGFLAPDMTMVVFWMLLWSTGAHLFMVLKSSIALRLAEEGKAGTFLGRLGGLENWGKLMGMLLLYWGVSSLDFSFSIIFGISGTCTIIAAICLFYIKPQPIIRPPRYLLLKKKYSLYYLLCMLFGARKQIFLTFAPWVLIKIFHCAIDTFALLGMIGTIASLILWPLLGRAVDAWGERPLIFLESLVLVLICILYGFAPQYFAPQIALGLIMFCFVIDQLLFGINIARTTYLNRIADSQHDIAPTISMGLTLDHAVSMTIPFLGGLLWSHFSYSWVFAAAAVIALVNLAASLFIPRLEKEKYESKIETLE